MSASNNAPSVKSIPVAERMTLVERFLREEHGQDLIEYALLFTFVGLGVIAAMKSVSASVATVFASIGTTLTNAT